MSYNHATYVREEYIKNRYRPPDPAKGEYVNDEPDLPALSPMYNTLWTLASPILRFDVYDTREFGPVRVYNNRIALFFNSYSSNPEWVHSRRRL
jgi:hypothetical protein